MYRSQVDSQLLLFPPCINDWLPDDHPAHFFNEVVEQFDMSEIYFI